MAPGYGLSWIGAESSRATWRGAAVFGIALALGLATASPAAASVWTAAANLSEEGQSAYGPQVAMDASGDATAVWTRFNGSNDVVETAVKTAEESWGTPVTVSEAGEEASEPQVAVDGAGDATIVWRRFNGSNYVVQVAVKPAGESWEKPATVSEAGEEASEPQIAVDAAGDATAIWTHYIGLSSGGMSNYVVQTALKPAGEAWEEPTTVSEESQEEGLEPQVAVDDAGDVTAVWKRFIYGQGRLIQTVAKPVGKPWGTPTTFEDGGDPRIAVNAAGDTAVVWTKYYGPGDVVQEAVKPVGEPWVKPAALSEDEASAPQVAVDASGDATAVWTRYIGFGFGKFIVQAAQYSPSTAFTIEMQHKLSTEPTYTKSELNGEVADTVDYEIIVKNTGSTSLKFGALKDNACESISPAGPTELEATTEETFTCTHKLTAFVKYSNEASIEGNEGTGTRTSNNVTVALAPVYEAPAGAADSNSGSCVESRVAVFVCSDLRAAVAYADVEPGSTVKLERGVYQLGYPLGAHAFLEITAGLTIQGAGPGETTIEQTDDHDPVIVIPYDAGFSQIEIEGVRLTGGVAEGEDDGEFGWETGGGALRILGSGTASSSVTLTNDDLTGDRAHAQNAKGGAIFNKRTLNIIDSTIAHNTALAEGANSDAQLGEANGGGIFNLGHLLIAGSTIADNTVEAGGVNSKAIGGGVDSGVENFTSEATAAIANTTITGNIASAGTTTNPPLVYGGGIAIDGGALNHVTLYDNTASPVNAWESWGGNVYEPQNGGGTWINNSIVAGGSASEGPNCMFTSGGSYPEDNRNNLEDGPDGECGFTLEYDPLVDVNPRLMPLADNGGPTETFAPEPGSPVIGSATECDGVVGESGSGGWETATVPLDVDQRGMPRNGHCDIGAFQTEPPFVSTLPQISGTAESGKTLTCTPGTWTGEGTLTYSYDWLRNGKSTGDQMTSYMIVPSDAESQIECLVTVSGTYGSTEATSPSVEMPPNAPTVVPGAASSVTQTTATLNATVDPNGGNVTKCEFEYAPTESFTRRAPCAVLPGSGDSAVSVSAAVTGLTASTTYHFRIVATNAGGTSDDTGETFNTLPNPPAGDTGEHPSTPSKAEKEPTVTRKHEQETSPTVTLASTALTAGSGGTLNVRVSCPAGASSCVGTVALETLNGGSAVTSPRLEKRKAGIRPFAVGSFNVAGGHVTTVKLHLSANARTLLAHVHVLRVRATILAHDPEGATHTTQASLTIHAAKAARDHEN
ncbi:MAG: choice-of-anchor Q domain-containing protein [Solirubrobacteraceae bacterium]